MYICSISRDIYTMDIPYASTKCQITKRNVTRNVKLQKVLAANVTNI
jgi:hypothetical protein